MCSSSSAMASYGSLWPVLCRLSSVACRPLPMARPPVFLHVIHLDPPTRRLAVKRCVKKLLLETLKPIKKLLIINTHQRKSLRKRNITGRLVMKRHGKQSRRMTMDYWKHLSQILFIMLRENVNWKENRVLN